MSKKNLETTATQKPRKKRRKNGELPEVKVIRTFFGHNVTFMVLGEDGNMVDTTVYIPLRDREKAVTIATQRMAGKGIFKSVEAIEERRQMPVEVFYANSEVITEDDGLITDEVIKNSHEGHDDVGILSTDMLD